MTFTPFTFIDVLIIFILMFFTLLLFNVGRHTRSNIYLGIYFISQMVVLFNMSFHPFPLVVHLIIQSLIFSWGAFYYLFINSLFNQSFSFKPRLLLHFIPVPIGLFFFLVDMQPGVNQFFQLSFPFLAENSKFFHDALFKTLIIGYNIATILKYYQFRNEVKAGKQTKSLVHPVWLNISVWGFIISCFCVQIGDFLNGKMQHSGFNWSIIGLLAFLIYFCILFYTAITSRTLTERPVIREKYKSSKLSSSDALKLLADTDDFMNSKQPYTNQELKLKDLAEQMNTQERTLSQIINAYKNQNFSDYVNSYRIEYAKNLLSDPALLDKTILWILFEAGFNSKATFNTLFKKVVGVTPAEFRKSQLQQNNN
jgi:AraC-like DNA-binding protein